MRVIAVVLGLGLASAAHAQSAPAAAEPDCTLARPAIPPEFAKWSSATGQEAAASRQKAASVALVLGQAVRLQLLPTAKVSYAVAPGKPGAADGFGGLAAFTVKTVGTYRVALGTGAWIDVVRGGKSLASTTHGHGPACSGIHKIVDFKLAPDTYLIQIAASAEPSATVLVAGAR